MRTFDAVVVGAGPAGLSAAAELATRGTSLVVDGGPEASARQRDAPDDLLAGVGGAGLFSDGKHSFYPSGTAVWQLPHRADLAAAFEATASLLREHGVEAGQLPSPDRSHAPVDGEWQPKLYPSIYIDFEARLACIEKLWALAHERWHGAHVVDARREGAHVVLSIARGGSVEDVRTRDVVIATGRWSPRWIRPWLERLGATFAFQRVELGVRIEASARNPLFARLPGTDGKLTLRDGTSEMRTFCTCRQGEVVLGRAGGLAAYSGRADGPPTGRSNVGLVVRSTDRELATSVLAAVERATPGKFLIANGVRTDLVAQLAPHFGAAGARQMASAIARLVAYEPALLDETVAIHAPCLEGVGDYPVDDGALQVAPGVWIAGDVHGRFRGIVASMISGRYAARRILAGT